MLINVLITDYCVKKFIKDLETGYNFEKDMSVVSSGNYHRVFLSEYLLEFKCFDSTVFMDVYLNVDDVPVEQKLAHLSKDLGERWWDFRNVTVGLDTFVTMCVDGYMRLH